MTAPMTHMTTPGRAPRVSRQRYDVVARWGGNALLLRNGFVPIATAFLRYAAQLAPDGLNPAETLFIIHLVSHKWTARAPFPSYGRLAERMGVSPGYCRKIARDLERRGFLTRTGRVGDSNEFDLTPLFNRLSDHIQATQEQSEEVEQG